MKAKAKLNIFFYKMSRSLFNSCILKIYFTGLLIVFKKYHIPKCITRYFIEEILEIKIEIIKFEKIPPFLFNGPMSVAKKKDRYHRYCFYRKDKNLYTNVAYIHKKCLITDFRKSFIDVDFSEDKSFEIYKYPISCFAEGKTEKETDDYILAIMNFYSYVNNKSFLHLLDLADKYKNEIFIPFFKGCDIKSIINILETYFEKIAAHIFKIKRLEKIKIQIQELKNEATDINLNF